MTSRHTPVISAQVARRLLLGAQGLLDDPTRQANRRTVRRLVDTLGYVQVDSINAVGERAHHLTLHARLDGYRPAHLQALLETERTVFEHWTHDASVIPIRWYPHWKVRFARFRNEVRIKSWCVRRMGDNPERILRRVRARLRSEGPLMARDFEGRSVNSANDANAGSSENGGWWNWHPEKAALEYLWRSGEVAIAARRGFQRVFDLSARVFPEVAAKPPSSPAVHLRFACEEALERLVIASPTEVARYFASVAIADVRRHCARAVARGELLPVLVEAEDGSAPRAALALPDYAERAAALPRAPNRARLLSPFDPIVRDRARAARLFDFDYRFEAFVPEKKRKYGYYVMPLLDGERIVGRVEPKYSRQDGVLHVKQVWWERPKGPTRQESRRLTAALERFATLLGAKDIAGPGFA